MGKNQKGSDKSIARVSDGSENQADFENRINRKVGVMKSMSTKAKRGKNKVNNKMADTNGKYQNAKNKVLNSPVFDFLKKLLITLVGYLAFKNVLLQMFNRELPKIESFLKMLLKDKLKELISCDMDAPIPTFLRYNNNGVNIRVDHIDFHKTLLTDPESEDGQVLYDDPLGGLNSKGFDTFLYHVLQTPNTDQGWGHQMGGQDIFVFKFIPTGAPEGNNVLNIRASSYYTTNKRLLDLNNDYIDSLSLFPPTKMMTASLTATFTPLTYNVHIPKAWLLQHEEVDLWIDKISNAEELIDIDDSFFEFTNDELTYMNEIVEQKYSGIRKLVSCTEAVEQISFDTMSAITANMLTATTVGTYVDLTDTITNSFDTISIEATGNVQKKDKFKFEMEFFNGMFEGLKSTMGNVLVTPKVVTLLQINNKIMYGENAPPYETMQDLIYKNKVIYNALLKLLTTIIAALLVALIIKALKKLIAENKEMQTAEAIQARIGQIMSLVGLSMGGVKEAGKMIASLADGGIPTDFSGTIGG